MNLKKSLDYLGLIFLTFFVLLSLPICYIFDLLH